MIKKTIVEKNRKYMLQFPEGTNTDKQTEYFGKLNAALEKDQFVAVDPKIKVFPATDSHVVEEEIPDPTPVPAPVATPVTPAEPAKPADPVAVPKPAEPAATETPAEPVKPTEPPTVPVEEPKPTAGVTIEKVEVNPPAKEKTVAETLTEE